MYVSIHPPGQSLAVLSRRSARTSSGHLKPSVPHAAHRARPLASPRGPQLRKGHELPTRSGQESQLPCWSCPVSIIYLPAQPPLRLPADDPGDAVYREKSKSDL